MFDLVEIGQRVKEARKAHRLSQARLADRALVSRARIEALENGRAPEFGVKNLVSVLNALGLDLRLTTLNDNRPTLDDLTAEARDASRLG